MNQNSNQITSTEERKKQDLPPGYKFRPTPLQIILYFLLNKLMGLVLPMEVIVDFDVDQVDPDKLPFDRFEKVGRMKGYFFAPSRSRKSRRNTPNGYWKIDEEKIPVHDLKGAKMIGFKDKLSFYCDDCETSWKMTEYRCNLEGNNLVEEKYIVCKVRFRTKVEAFNWQQKLDDSDEDSDTD